MAKYESFRDFLNEVGADSSTGGFDSMIENFSFLSHRNNSEIFNFVSEYLSELGLLDHSNKMLKILKNDKISEKWRQEGNKLLANGDYMAAIEKFNKSLCYAESNLNFALAYADRSVVCFRLQMYSACLRNIELAKLQDSSLIYLDERAEKCHRLIVEGAETDENMLKPSGEEFLNLSHPAHQKLPYIADCLDVKFNDEFGRHVITNKKLLPGEIVCIESPVFKSLYSANIINHCTYCMKDNFLILVSCPLSTSAMFCSEKCKDEAFESYYEIKVDVIDEIRRICLNDCNLIAVEIFFTSLRVCQGDLNKLQQIVEESENNAGVTIFDINEKCNEINILKMTQSLESHKTKHQSIQKFLCYASVAIIVDLFLRHSKLGDLLTTDNEKYFLQSFLLKNAQIAMVNGYELGKRVFYTKEHLYGARNAGTYDENHVIASSVGIFPFLSMISHSCSPNVTRVGDSSEMFLYVLRVIEPGEQLTLSYLYTFEDADFDKRQEKMRRSYFFECKCEACVMRYPTKGELDMRIVDAESMKKMNLIIHQMGQMQKMKIEAVKNLVGEICNFLITNRRMYPCIELMDIQECLERCYKLMFMPKLSLKFLD